MKEKIKVQSVSRNIRLRQRDFDYLMRESSNVSINKGIDVVCHMMQTLEAKALTDLSGAFTEGEWKYMAIVLRYAPLTDEQRLDRELLHQQLRTAYGSVELLEKYDVDMSELSVKILCLYPLSVLALCNRIRDFWLSNPDWSTNSNRHIGIFNQWAKY